MSYGLDFSDYRFLTDHKGNKLRADIPYAMFSMLIECRQAALAAQTRQIEEAVNRAAPVSRQQTIHPTPRLRFSRFPIRAAASHSEAGNSSKPCLAHRPYLSRHRPKAMLRHPASPPMTPPGACI